MVFSIISCVVQFQGIRTSKYIRNSILYVSITMFYVIEQYLSYYLH